MPEDTTREVILQKIKQGEVTMHSRTFLVWRSTLMTLAWLLLIAAGGFLLSFAVYILQANGVWDLPQFGSHGLREFILYFPWLFVPAVLLFIWLTERFVRLHSSAYRLPILYVSLVSAGLITLAGVIVLVTPLHSSLQSGLPGGVYRFFEGRRPDDFYVGQITSIKPDGCALMTGQGQQINVLVDPHTQIYNNYTLRSGDYVEVLGDEQNGQVQAYDIRKVQPGNFPPPPPGTEVR